MQPESPVSDNSELRFRELYYHLYSNSSSSRSERILADLSKLILLSVIDAAGDGTEELDRFLTGSATANSSVLPLLNKHFPAAMERGESFSLDDAALRHAYKLLAEIDLVSSPSHTFGDAFQALMGPRLRGDKGQFFTPRSVVRAMVKILAPRAGMKVIDPACGTGGFLSAVLDGWREERIQGTAVGIDKDSDLSLLASALSTVHSASGAVHVHNANSLDLANLTSLGIELGTFDQVLTNPPFGAKIGITDRRILSEFSLGHVWERAAKGSAWSCTSQVRSTQDPQVLFIELCVRLLKPGGSLGIVLPEGIFGNSNSGYIWDYLRSEGEIVALIDCPRTTFQPGTDTKTNILFFNKSKSGLNGATDESWIAVAYSCGHDRRGRTIRADGQTVSDDFVKLAADWHRPAHQRQMWSRTTISDPYYLVPRYYDQRLTDDVAADAEKLNSPVVTLGQLVKKGLISIRKGHEVGSEAYGTGDIPFVRTSDIHNFEVSHDPTNCVSEDVYLRYKDQQRLSSGDILMVVDGRYKIGRCAILHDWTKDCVVQSHLRIISVTEDASFAPIALLYGLSLPSVQREIRRLVFIQSTLGGLGNRINEIRLPDPRSSTHWGDAIRSFAHAVNSRAEQAMYLQSFGHEVEL